MVLRMQNNQLASRIGVEGTYNVLVEAAAQVKHPTYDCRVNYEVNQFRRAPEAGYLGSLASVPGARIGRVTCRADLKGSGTAGVPPGIGTLLLACGMAETLNTGTASFGTTVKDPGGASGTLLASELTFSGTPTGAKSGKIHTVVESIVTDTSVTFRHSFQPGDLTPFETVTTVHTDTSAVSLGGTLLAGVSMATSDDPSVATAGYALGEKFVTPLTSDQQVDAAYTMLSTSLPVTDLAIYQDGRQHALHSCRGSWRIIANWGESPMIEFDFLGIINANPVDAALLSGPSFDDVGPTAFSGVTLTHGGSGFQCATAFELDLGNNLIGRRCVSEATGYKAADITARDIVGSLDPEAALIATEDPFADLFTNVEEALILTIGSTAGKIIQIDAPKFQITELTDDVRDAYHVDSHRFSLNRPEFDAGGVYGEMTLTFK